MKSVLTNINENTSRLSGKLLPLRYSKSRRIKRVSLGFFYGVDIPINTLRISVQLQVFGLKLQVLIV